MSETNCHLMDRIPEPITLRVGELNKTWLKQWFQHVSLQLAIVLSPDLTDLLQGGGAMPHEKCHMVWKPTHDEQVVLTDTSESALLNVDILTNNNNPKDIDNS